MTLQRDFAHKWVESLKVKDARPRGEVAIDRMLHEQDKP
jgi:hypothetical protein